MLSVSPGRYFIMWEKYHLNVLIKIFFSRVIETLMIPNGLMKELPASFFLLIFIKMLQRCPWNESLVAHQTHSGLASHWSCNSIAGKRKKLWRLKSVTFAPVVPNQQRGMSWTSSKHIYNGLHARWASLDKSIIQACRQETCPPEGTFFFGRTNLLLHSTWEFRLLLHPTSPPWPSPSAWFHWGHCRVMSDSRRERQGQWEPRQPTLMEHSTFRQGKGLHCVPRTSPALSQL